MPSGLLIHEYFLPAQSCTSSPFRRRSPAFHLSHRPGRSKTEFNFAGSPHPLSIKRHKRVPTSTLPRFCFNITVRFCDAHYHNCIIFPRQSRSITLNQTTFFTRDL
jgi:hypothetical protein